MNRLTKAFHLLSKKERKKAIVVFVFMVIGMLFEMMGIGLIIPLMQFVRDTESVKLIPYGNIAYEYIKELNINSVIALAFILFALLISLKTIVLSKMIRYQTGFSYDLLTGVSSRLFFKYLKQDYIFFKKNNSSVLMKNVITDSNLFITHLVSPFICVVTELLVIFGILILLLFIDLKGTLFITLIIILLSLIVFFVFRKKLAHLGGERTYYEGQRLRVLNEGLGSIKDLKLAKKEETFYKHYLIKTKKTVDAIKEQVYLNQLPRIYLEFIAVLLLCSYVLFQLYHKVDFQKITEILAIYALAAFRLLPSINRIVGSASAIQFSKNIIDNLYLEEPLEKNILNINKNDFDGMRLENVSFGYEEGDPILKKISININKGEMIGIIGSSGSGKSTLIDVIIGLLPVTEGDIEINNISKGQTLIEALGSKISYVGQNISLIDSSILTNIILEDDFEKINIDRVNQILKMLALDDLIESLDGGVNFIIGENGMNLSGGQKQRLGIARALYKDFDVLILDEATSALDFKTEQIVIDVINKLKGKYTIIIIAHRLSTITHCDMVYEIEKGVIKNSGKPKEVAGSNV